MNRREDGATFGRNQTKNNETTDFTDFAD